jgi:hypothetical protein
MDSARAARRERSHRAHSWLSLTMAPTLHSTLYLNSLDPRGKIHTIHASTKAPKTHLFGSSRSAKGGD